jgi:molecular chaperone GrpE (heat shock protein)
MKPPPRKEQAVSDEWDKKTELEKCEELKQQYWDHAEEHSDRWRESRAEVELLHRRIERMENDHKRFRERVFKKWGQMP